MQKGGGISSSLFSVECGNRKNNKTYISLICYIKKKNTLIIYVVKVNIKIRIILSFWEKND